VALDPPPHQPAASKRHERPQGEYGKWQKTAQLGIDGHKVTSSTCRNRLEVGFASDKFWRISTNSKTAGADDFSAASHSRCGRRRGLEIAIVI
jgi:hypothetical protein